MARPSGKERSSIILFSLESFLSLVFSGDIPIGCKMGFELNGPTTELNFN